MVEYLNLPVLKEGRVFAGVAEVHDKLVVTGGCDAQGKAQKTVQILDLVNGKEVSKGKDMPRVKAGAVTLSTEAKVITLGGIYDKQCPLKNVDVLDLELDIWHELPPLYSPVQGPIAIVKENVLYCGGGLTTGMNTLNDFVMMDLSVGKWEYLPKMTSSHFHAGSFLHNNNFYVIGGRQGKLSNRYCECFDFRAGIWRVLPSIPDEFCNVFSSYIHSDKYAYVIAGMNENPQYGFSNLVYRFDLSREKWEKLPNILKPRADFSSFCNDDQIVIAGGMGQLQGLATSVEIFDTNTKRWSIADDLPCVHASSSRCVYKHSMLLVGGMSPSGPSNNITEVRLPK